MRNLILVLFLLVITNPYEGRGIDYAKDEPQLYEYSKKLPYQIKVYGPEDNDNEISYTDEETARFIKKVDAIINYSPYVYQ